MKTALRNLALLLVAALCLPFAATAQTNLAQPPGQISYQGFLTDANGLPLATNTPQNYNVVFNIYDAANGGNVLWGESQVVTVNQGYFTVLLGVGNALPGNVPFHTNDLTYLFNSPTAQNRYIGLTVSGLGVGEIVPRLRLLASPYALLAANAVNVVGNNIISAANLNTNIGLWTSAGTNVYYNKGNVGVGTSTPQDLFDVNGPLRARDTTATDGFVGLVPGNATQAGYVEWWRPNNVRMAYMGWDANNVNLNLAGGANFYVSGGNFGIGNSTPTFPLSFPNTLGDKISIWTDGSGNSYGLGLQSGLLQVHSAGYGSDIAFGYGSSASFTENMRIKSYGYVGIGRSDPQGTLHVYEAAGTWGSQYAGTLTLEHGDHGGHSSIVFPSRNNYGSDYGYISFQDDVNNGGGTAEGALLTIGVQNDPNDHIALMPSGNVGVGTSTPTTARLVVANGFVSQTGYIWNGSDLAVASGYLVYDYAFYTGNNVSIQASSWICSSAGFIVDSDLRVKNVIGRSDSAEDLRRLRRLEVTDYQYKDVVARGTNASKKVIAQQVESVYPQAVSRSKDTIPDIYKLAKIADGWVQLATDLKVGDRVRLIAKGEDVTYNVKEIREGAFRTAFNPTNDQVFVYGREVDDFRKVDYDAIAMLNVSATQELARQFDAKQAELAAVQTEVARLRQEKTALTQRLSEVESREAARDARLARLETLLTDRSVRTQRAALDRE